MNGSGAMRGEGSCSQRQSRHRGTVRLEGRWNISSHSACFLRVRFQDACESARVCEACLLVCVY